MDDEKYYERVAEEMRNDEIRDGLWTKALSTANGDEKAARARYITLRVEQLMSSDRQAVTTTRAAARTKKFKQSRLAIVCSVAYAIIAIATLPPQAANESVASIKMRTDWIDILQKSKNLSDAVNLIDPYMSPVDYDKLRFRYFNDVVAPKVRPGYSVEATMQDFMNKTERPQPLPSLERGLVRAVLLFRAILEAIPVIGTAAASTTEETVNPIAKREGLESPTADTFGHVLGLAIGIAIVFTLVSRH